MTNNMVRTTGLRTVKDDQTWRYGEQLSGTVSVTLDMDVFQAITNADRDKYFTGYTDDATDFYIKSGLPLARITSGAAAGLYGPYNPSATDGRKAAVAGLLESNIHILVTAGGWVVDDTQMVGMRFRGNVIVENLPGADVTDAVWNGDFVAVDPDTGVTKRLLNEDETAATPPSGN